MRLLTRLVAYLYAEVNYVVRVICYNAVTPVIVQLTYNEACVNFCPVDDNGARIRQGDTVTSRINADTESVFAAAFNCVQRSAGSDEIVSSWLLLSTCPDVCYYRENDAADLPGDSGTMNVCGASLLQLQQLQRSPLSLLFGSAVTSTVTESPCSLSADAVTAAPWRPFSVHEDRPISPAPSLSTTAGSTCMNGDLGRSLAAAESTVDEVNRAVPQHQTFLRSTVEQQCTATSCLPRIPFVPILLDGLTIDQFHHQRLLGSVHQQVVHGSFVYPAVATGCVVSTARQQCSQCGLVFSTLEDLTRHQQSSCSSLPSSSSSSPTQSGSTGSPSTRSPRSPSPLLSCPHCDKTYTSSGALKMHVRTHTLPCRCPVCGKSFSRPWLLQGHLRTHTGERPFRCAVCGRAFADRSNLRAHAQTHSAAKRYQCTGCRRSFSRLSLLVRHERHNTSGCCRDRHGNADAKRQISGD